jgi:AbiV family abortive infection protein
MEPITDPQDLLTLAEKSLKNANQLHSEAKLLYEYEHFARALFLAQIGGEEIGKHVLCFSSYLDFRCGIFDFTKFQKRFYNHKEKTFLSNFMEDSLLNPVLSKSVEERKSESTNLEKLKLTSLYTDSIDGKVINPTEVIESDWANGAITWLRNKLDLFGDPNSYSIIDRFKEMDDKEAREYYDGFMEKYSSDTIIND